MGKVEYVQWKGKKQKQTLEELMHGGQSVQKESKKGRCFFNEFNLTV